MRRKRGRGEPLRRAQLTRGWEQIGAPARGGAGEGGAPSRWRVAVAFGGRRRVGGAPARWGGAGAGGNAGAVGVSARGPIIS